MRHGRLPLIWGENGRGGGKGGKSYWGARDYRNGMTLSQIIPDGVENSLSAYNLVLSPRQIIKGAFSPSLFPVRFLSVYRDDSCRQFRKCRPNVSVELGSLKFFLFFLPGFLRLSDH